MTGIFNYYVRQRHDGDDRAVLITAVGVHDVVPDEMVSDTRHGREKLVADNPGA